MLEAAPSGEVLQGQELSAYLHRFPRRSGILR